MSRQKGWCIGRKKGGVLVMTNPKGRCISKKGWCVGRNPPSVVCGIRLIGLPAPSGRCLIGGCLPFPLAGRPFHRFQAGALSVTNASWRCHSWTFRFCSVANALALPFMELQFYTWAEFPQTQRTFGSESHTPTRQPTR